MSSDPLIGAVVDGKYRVEALLGRGGMGAVYRAVHAGTDRTVALKVIAGTLAGDPEYVERFRREARACGRLRHPGIVDVTDFGVATHLGQPLPYLVMEFLDGRTLADALREQPRPPLPWVIDVLEQVCAAVEVAHQHGILHRDLKPENVWLERDRRGGVNVKVLDFGLAKLDSSEDQPESHSPVAPPRSSPLQGGSPIDATLLSATMATMASAGGSSSTGVAGTPAYMSPEQAIGEPATTRSDVYSIGVIAYRMITGQLPYEGSLEEVLTAKITREAPPVMTIRPDVHTDAGNLVALAMSKDPMRRPASAGVFGNMLAAQLEPAGAFFTRAFVLMVSRLSMFTKFALLFSGPLLVACALASVWQALGLLGYVPYLTARPAVMVILALFLVSMPTQLFSGVMPLLVLHALAAPTRPIAVVQLLRANAHRVRLFLSGVLPLMIGMLGILAAMFLVVVTTRYFGEQVRMLPRPARVALVLVTMTAPFAIAYVALRRRGLGLRGTGLLGSVLLIEQLPVREAVQRSMDLMVESGGLRNAVQRRYMGVVVVLSCGAGVGMGAGGAIGRAAGTFLMLTPLVALAGAVLLSFNAIIGAMIYVSARRSKGESLDVIYGDLVRNPQGETS